MKLIQGSKLEDKRKANEKKRRKRIVPKAKFLSLTPLYMWTDLLMNCSFTPKSCDHMGDYLNLVHDNCNKEHEVDYESKQTSMTYIKFYDEKCQ